MNLHDLLNKLTIKDIKIKIEGDSLKYTAPQGIMTEEIKQQIIFFKKQLIQLLRDEKANPLFMVSSAQHRIILSDKLFQGNPAYNIAKAVRITKNLNIYYLQKALDIIITRHKILNTNIVETQKDFQLSIREELPKLLIEELENKEEDIIKKITESAHKALNIYKDCLIKVTLYKTSGNNYIFSLLTHHLVADGWSISIFIKELLEIYQGFIINEKPKLPNLKYQYWDYSLLQNSLSSSDSYNKQIQYWRNALIDAPVSLELPYYYPVKKITNNGNTIIFNTPHNLDFKIREYVKQRKVTLFLFLLTCFQLLLSKYTHLKQITTATSISNRRLSEFENLIGPFFNNIVFYNNIKFEQSFNALLEQVTDNYVEIIENQDIPLEDIIKELNIDRSAQSFPFLQVFFVLHESMPQKFDLGSVNFEIIDIENKTAQFEINLNIINQQNNLRFLLEYNTDLFSKSTMEIFIQNYLKVINTVIDRANEPLYNLCFFNDEQYNEISRLHKPGKHGYSDTIKTCLNKVISRSPNEIAVKSESGELTFYELVTKANQLSHWLANQGAEKESRIAICMNRSIESIIAMLGTINIGACFVPIDIDAPLERKVHALKDSGATIILMSQEASSFLNTNDLGVKKLILEYEWETEISHLPITSLAEDNLPTDLIYIMYTSGTTGIPKGVAVMHKNILRLIQSFDFIQTDPQQIFLNYAPISFDAAMFEIFCSLCFGNKLVILSDKLSAGDFISFIESNKISVMWLTSGLFNTIIDNEEFINYNIEYLLVGGDIVSSSHISKAYPKFPNCQFINGYGPTECATFSSLHLINKNDVQRAKIPIGKPIKNTQMYILDDYYNPLPTGIPGMLYIGGNGVALGYWKDPELTAQKFTPSPFNNVIGERLYNTGDLALCNADGTIDFIGRRDTQIKIRGYRVELSEIEVVINEHPSVQNGVVIVKHFSESDKRIIAFVKYNYSNTGNELLDYLKNTLSHYMCPSIIMKVDNLPLTKNGKIDRKKLEEIKVEFSDRKSFLEPLTPTEIEVASIWSEILEVPDIGLEDDFFDIGGDSLIATQIISQINKRLKIEVPLKELFDFSNLKQFADAVSKRFLEAPKNLIPHIFPTPRKNNRFPLSFAQQRMWFLNKLDPNNPAYNISLAVELKGILNIDNVKKCFEIICSRHESLRTTFYEENSQVYQRVSDKPNFNFLVVSLEDIPNYSDKVIDNILQEEASIYFDLSKGPLLSINIIKLTSSHNIIILTMHHIISDGWSLGILVKEFSQIYSKLEAKEEAILPPLQIQYIDFTTWQNKYINSGLINSQVEYWKEKLNNLNPILDFPTDFLRSKVQTYEGDSEPFTITLEQLQNIKTITNNSNSTLFMFLLAVFKILLHRYTGEKNIAIGTPIANRNFFETESIIGFFVNTLIIRSLVSPKMTFLNILEQIKQLTIEAYANQDIPFEHIVDMLQPERSLSYTPFTQLRFILQNAPVKDLDIEGLSVKSKVIRNKTSKFDFTFAFIENENGLEGVVEYNTSLFMKETITRLILHYKNLLNCIIAAPNSQVNSYNFLTYQENQLLLYKQNYPYNLFDCLHTYFEHNAKNFPKSIAIKYGGKEITYQEANNISNYLAHLFIKEEIVPGDTVAICLNNPINRTLCMLALLKIGAAFIPLDPNYPAVRLSNLLIESSPKLLLADEEKIINLYDGSSLTINDTLLKVDDHFQIYNNLNIKYSSLQTAYIIYTSGSTGKQKGVCVSNLSVVNYAKNIIFRLKLKKGNRIAAMSSCAADFGYTAIFASLYVGATLYFIEEEYYLDPDRLVQLFDQYPVDFLKIVPSHLRVLTETSNSNKLMPNLALILGGEVCDISLMDKLKEFIEDKVKIIIHYGPTEATVGVSTYTANRKTKINKLTVPIGTVFKNCCFYILDANLNPVPFNVIGRLYIGGLCLAQGYFNNPEATAKSFLPNPFVNSSKERRLYDTGDLVRRLSDGNLEFIGRADSQIKIRGYRIELGEIETGILAFGKIKNAVAINEKQKEELYAFIVLDDQEEVYKEFEESHVVNWEHFYNQLDREQGEEVDPNVSYHGWNSSYTGLPIPYYEMEEWKEIITSRILSLRPNKILEIGCGYGLFLFSLIDNVEKYTGLDFSELALTYVRSLVKQKCLLGKVDLLKQRAHELDNIENNIYDTIVINSVTQYFPSIGYLISVLKQCIKIIKKPGKIFIGDIRNLLLYDTFIVSTVLHNTKNKALISSLTAEVNTKRLAEQELLINPNFFTKILNDIPEITSVKVLPRKSTIDNELLTYRYDAVIFVGEKGEVYNINNIISNFKNDLTVQDVRTILIKTNPEHLAILYIPNAKLQRIIPLVASTHSSSMFDSTIEKITKINNQSYVEDQISLDNIIQLSEELNYKTEISWIGSDRRGSYNVILFKPHLETKQFSLKINDTLDYNEQNVYSNNPLKIEYQNNLIIQLKAFLSERLLDAMIPSKIYCLYKIPLLPNGKTDRRFLLSLVNDDTQKRSVYIPPRNDIERYLVRLVEDILNISSISITDNFFDLGGHSLLATRLITKIRADYQITISIKVVFEYPVIEHLANQIQNHLTFNKIKVLPLKRVFQRDRFFPLSYSQRRLWFLHYFESVKATYNRPIILKMRGNLNVMALKSSIQRIIDRHEVLRTSFPKVKGEPLQQIHKDFVLEIPLIDLSYQETDQEIQKYVQKAQKHVFELEKSPPIIANILKLDKENYFLIITVHHIISDGWSINIFVNELSKIYSSIIYKKNLKLPTLKIQYGDYAAWQKKWFSSGILDKQILYWKNQLSDLPLLTQLPLNYPRPEKQSYHGRTKTFKLSKLVYEKLVRICDQKGVTLFMLLLTIFKLLIHKQIHQTDLVVGTPLANRVRPEIENLIGFFVNTLVIRTTVTPDMTFNKYLMSVKQVLLEAYDNQDLPFEKIVEIVNPQRNLSFSPLFQIMFILQNTSMSEISLPGITTTAAELDFTVANFDMTFQVYERPDGLDCSLEYNSDIYSSERMSDFINRFKILTNIILTGTEEKISNISTLSGDEKTKILQVWSKQQFNYQEYSFLGKDSIVLLDEDYNL